MKRFYFSPFEHRLPEAPVPDNVLRTYLFQFLAILTLGLGLAYLTWRWTSSINPQALWFSIPLLLAETLSMIGTGLFIFSLWSNKDPQPQKPVSYLSEIEDLQGRADRPLKIDVFIATYNEEVELVRYSIRDAKKMVYPHAQVPIRIYVLDDGKRDGRDPARENMRQLAQEEGVAYLARETNQGYKAGNLKHALEQTDGDLFVILDADTRPFPSLLAHTTGYFRNPKLAWVQTPQWFYDLTEPLALSAYLRQKLGRGAGLLGAGFEKLFGQVQVGSDVFGNDPSLFYEVIQRRANFHNAAFCCGAGSVHRREAVMALAVQDFKTGLEQLAAPSGAVKPGPDTWQVRQALRSLPLTPFKFHASEDIYTSISLHADEKNKWESLLHPQVECKMLSPQDLDTWVKQRTRYAQGSLDIAFHDNPLLKKGLSWRQKLCYLMTIWSYFSPLWILVFLLSPIIFFFTLTPPVQAFNFTFFKHFIPFQVLNTLTMTLAYWGLPRKRAEQFYIASFWLVLVSMWAVLRGKKVKFDVTAKQRQQTRNLPYILPHLIIMGLTLLGILYNIVLISLDLHPSLSGFCANVFWSLYNIYHLSSIVRAAFWEPDLAQAPPPDVQSRKKRAASWQFLAGARMRQAPEPC